MTDDMPLKLCRLDELPDGQSRGFFVDMAHGRKSLLAVRTGTSVYVYVNACPHIGTPLDIKPDQFLNGDGSLIICSTHGALFEIDTGFCISGPCAGAGLSPMKSHIKQGWVMIAPQDDIPPPRDPKLMLGSCSE